GSISATRIPFCAAATAAITPPAVAPYTTTSNCLGAAHPGEPAVNISAPANNASLPGASLIKQFLAREPPFRRILAGRKCRAAPGTPLRGEASHQPTGAPDGWNIASAGSRTLSPLLFESDPRSR